MAEEVTKAALQGLQGSTNRTEAKRNFWARLRDFIENPLTLGALFLLGGIVGAILFTPAFIICALCLLFGFHRAAVVADQPLKIQVAVFLVLALIISVGGYFLYGLLDSKLQEVQTEFAKKVASFVGPSRPSTNSASITEDVSSRNSDKVTAVRKSSPAKEPAETKPKDLGVHSPSETVTLPPNSSAIFAYGNLSPEGRASLDRMEKEGIEAKEHLTKDQDRLTLHDLFITDFVVGDADTTSSNRSGFTIRNNDTGVLTHIEYIVIRQVETGTKFLLFYVLYTNETGRICKDLADKYEVALNDFLEGRVDTQKTPGDAEATTSQTLVFSKRIFIYHETYLSPEEVIDIRNAYQERGLTVILRSTDYLDNQKLKAKLRSENKH